MDDTGPAAAKGELRAALLAARSARPVAELDRLRAALGEVVLARAIESGWRRVAAYEPLRTEPGSTALLAGLIEVGVDVLVPITLEDRDLDWEPWPGRGARGVAAVAAVDAVLAPALAVGRDGTRLGRGGGSYDRALARCGVSVLRVALTFDDEVLPAVPHDPWDEPVDAVATPSGWTQLRNTGVARGD